MFFFALCIWLLKSNEISGMLKKGQTTLQVWLKLVNHYDGDEVYLLENRILSIFFLTLWLCFCISLKCTVVTFSKCLQYYIYGRLRAGFATHKVLKDLDDDVKIRVHLVCVSAVCVCMCQITLI